MDKIKLDKNFFDKLNVAVERQYFAGKKTLLGMFDLINTNIVDNKIDKKEFVNFANSILTADTNGDTIIDGSELELYIKNNADFLIYLSPLMTKIIPRFNRIKKKLII